MEESEAGDLIPARYFDEIARLVNRHSGIQLPAAKKHMVEGRLRKRARQIGHRGLQEYCRFLFEDGGFEREFPHLVDVITTNKTDFFREPDHFEVLRKLVPHMLARHERREQFLKVWSAASSNGAEAYTIAMTLADLAPRQDFRFAILATDLCSQVLEEGRRAVYPAELMAPVPADFRRKYVMQARKSGATVRIVPELRRLVTFAQMNLMDERYPVEHAMDAIFLRNVLIYFDRGTQARVITRIIRHLAPEGCLFLGHTESMVATGLPLKQIAPAVFQKSAR